MTNTVEIIENKLEDFGLENINAATTVLVNKEDKSDVEVLDSDFNTFTKAHATLATYFVEYDDVLETYSINTEAIERFVSEEVQ